MLLPIDFLANEDPEATKLFTSIVYEILGQAETDLGFELRPEGFYPTGAKLLDEKLVNDSLHWLRDKNAQNVLEPFEKGLRDLLLSKKEPGRLADVVTDMYEAVEALAKNVVGNDKDLSTNREMFISKVKASDDYKKLLKQYVEYANEFRHAATTGGAKPRISEREAESFVYLTGIFIRLAAP